MAVVILNVSERHGVEYGKGLQHYELKVNERTLCVFTHTFEDKLAVCLRKATLALEEESRCT